MKQKCTFKIGEIVELKSGGPKMTVTEIIATGKVRCSWFVGSKHASTVFPLKSLQIPGEDRRIAIMHETLKRVIGVPAEIEEPAVRLPLS